MQRKKIKNKIQCENVKKKFLLGEKFINNSLDFKHRGKKNSPMFETEKKNILFFMCEKKKFFFSGVAQKEKKIENFCPQCFKV